MGHMNPQQVKDLTDLHLLALHTQIANSATEVRIRGEMIRNGWYWQVIGVRIATEAEQLQPPAASSPFSLDGEPDPEEVPAKTRLTSCCIPDILVYLKEANECCWSDIIAAV